MDNQLQTLQPELRTLYDKLITTIPVDKQLSWLQLCNGKAQILQQLQAKELEVQSLLLNYETFDLLKLQEKLDEYKKQIKEIPELRKSFTRYMDSIIDEMMAPEKRVAVWENFTKAVARYNELRLDKDKKDKEIAAKNLEAERFKTHVKNEQARIQAQYKVDLLKHINDSYKLALGDDTLTEYGIKQYISTTQKVLNDQQLSDPVKFNYVLHTKEELIKINSTIEAPNYQAVLSGAMGYLDNIYKMYFQDRANKVQAVTFLDNKQSEQQSAIKTDLENTQAVNTLMTTSTVSQISSGDGIRELKRKSSIVVNDASPDWAMKIISAFLANWNKVIFHVRIKKFGNLNVSQMASALDDAEIKVEGVDYVEQVK